MILKKAIDSKKEIQIMIDVAQIFTWFHCTTIWTIFDNDFGSSKSNGNHTDAVVTIIENFMDANLRTVRHKIWKEKE